MSQTVAALIPAAVDYERTLILAVEVSNKSWVLAAQVPGPRTGWINRAACPQNHGGGPGPKTADRAVEVRHRRCSA
jgi:hypothetical protein